MTRRTKIYKLQDPDSLEVRYVGKTVHSLDRRLTSHMKPNPTTYSGKWVNSLLAQGKKPLITLIEEVGDEWPERERYWIGFYRDQGSRLTNLAEGGLGPSGFAHSDAAKLAISEALRKRARKPETAAKIAESLRGHSVSDDAREKIRLAAIEQFSGNEARRQAADRARRHLQTEVGLAQLAKMIANRAPASEETKKKLSEAGKKRYSSQEERSLQSAKIKAASSSPESREKRSEAQKRRWATIGRRKRPDDQNHATVTDNHLMTCRPVAVRSEVPLLSVTPVTLVTPGDAS
jgi:hypothetical protein